MITIDPKEKSNAEIQGLFQGAIAPRPIALASTVDADGNINLSPFSFFNMFSTRPPILVFSPSRRGRNNTTKHTYENIKQVPEVVINIVNFDMVEQTSLASVEFPKGVNEFIKSGLTPVPSTKVKPPRVGESPASFECVVKQMIPLGGEGGAGILVICEVILAHFKEEILDARGRVDPQKLDAVSRMGGDYYCRAHGPAVFSVPKPTDKTAIGFDQLPLSVRGSHVLTGNDLGRLGSVERLPAVTDEFKSDPQYRSAAEKGEVILHRLAQNWIREGRIDDAWRALLSFYQDQK